MLSEEQEQMRELVEKLPFRVDHEVIEQALEIANEIEADAESLYPEVQTEKKQRGTIANDEYNSLLDIYDTPRTEAGNSGIVSGLTVAIKDVITLKGLSMTCGSRSCTYTPSYDASVVERLLDEGAEIMGKANCDAFAFGPTGEFSEFGKVTNPIDPDHVPGGSSSGSAAAVKGGLVDMALGTDTGGSIRIPASCCGVVGMKPTHGLVPRYGLADLAPSTDVIGPIATDVETAAETLEVIAGHDMRDPTSSHVETEPIHNLETDATEDIAVPQSFLNRSSDAVTSMCREVADRLAQNTESTVEEVELDFGNLESAYPLTLATEYAWLLRQSFVQRGQGTQYNKELQTNLLDADFNDHVALRVLPAAYLDKKTDGTSYITGRQEAIAFKQRVETLFEEFDVLMTPTLRVAPPTYSEVNAAEGMEDITGNTMPFSLSGYPAVSVPGGHVDGLPIGMQIVAPHFEDKRALQVAKQVEEIAEI